ncbi:hypothetical protein O0I10_000164 [Lichtheimia ornata]|uniref:Uncharacterized protein n=1 Tax=Lichtheimia ornata TaxID=688661 RepID=A0AAD7Y519_9FUNG|nr:uncharacterized protein O0I10_000164 [Lichtheimia ornata]KAJ8663889.1 hypothetical protein O0I10_000164 [Lichtheimia ornata]
MARILFTISLALAALSVVVSGAPTTNNKRCEDGGDCEVFVERSDEACDYEYYDDEDEFTKRDWHVSPYCMTPWEYDVVLRMCDDDLDDLEEFYEEFYDEFYEDLGDAVTKRHRRPVFNTYANLPPRCFPYAYYDRFQTMVASYAVRDAITKRTFIPGNYHQGYGHHGGNHHGYGHGMTREEYEDWLDEHN